MVRCDIVVILLTVYIMEICAHVDSVENEMGHLRPLGEGRPIQRAAQVEGFPHTKWLFENFVKQSKPLLMKNAAKLSPAFTRWTDDYFLEFDEADDYLVKVDPFKTDKCTLEAPRPVTEKHSLSRFLHTYNESDVYMMSAVPDFLTRDVVLPAPLQCPDIMTGVLVEHAMWFSSGGTKSNMHYDPLDNINCVFRGTKVFLLVPEAFSVNIEIDHPEGSVCGLDVDRADYMKYPGLAEMEYYNITVEAGDCLYLPYRMFHVVRSYHSNIAVNLWWDYFLGLKVDLNRCPDQFNTDITLDKAEYTQWRQDKMQMSQVKDHLMKYEQRFPLSLEKTVDILLSNIIDELNKVDPSKHYMISMRKMFNMLDVNLNNTIELGEVTGGKVETWNAILKELTAIYEIADLVDDDDQSDLIQPHHGSDEL